MVGETEREMRETEEIITEGMIEGVDGVRGRGMIVTTVTS